MANNKVIDKDENILIDLTADTATESDVVLGKTFHDRYGVQRTGTLNASLPQLHAPSITINKSTKTINITNVATNGDYVTGYGIYLNSVLVATISTTSYDFTSLLSEYGAYNFTVKAKGTGFEDSVVSNEIIYQYVDPTTVGTLEETSWAKIKEICEAGLAPEYWNLGDTKTVIGGDGYTRLVKLVHMGDIYNGKKAVFQFWNTNETDTFFYNSQTPDNYQVPTASVIWPMLRQGGSVFNEMVDSELGNAITDTVVKCANKGYGDGIAFNQEITTRLFLPAIRECSKASEKPSVAVDVEWDGLIGFGYYETVEYASTARIRKIPSTDEDATYWLRSPAKGYGTGTPTAVNGGYIEMHSCYNYGKLAPCFAF